MDMNGQDAETAKGSVATRIAGGVFDRWHTDVQGGIPVLRDSVMVFTCHRIPAQTQPM